MQQIDPDLGAAASRPRLQRPHGCRWRSPAALTILVTLLAGTSAPAPEAQPDAWSLAQQGLALARQGHYRAALDPLATAWEATPTDPVVAEHLAMAWLYGPGEIDQAERLMHRALELGGQATFLVRHPHRGDEGRPSCAGRLSVTADGIVFLGRPPAGHTLGVPRGAGREASLTPGRENTVSIPGPDGVELFRPSSYDPTESHLLLRLLHSTPYSTETTP